MRVFLDANILFSAADTNSATYRLLLQVAEQAELITHPHARDEAVRNLEVKRAHLLPEFERLMARVELSNALGDVSTLTLNEKDKPILGGAIASRCTHLWTSDKTHFGHLYGQSIQGVTILSSLHLFSLVEGNA